MEALVAVGLASNVLQFVEFTAKLISISNELRNHAASSENRDHLVIATHLATLSQNISDSAKAISQTSTSIASSEEKELQPVADKCCELAKSLLERLDTCGIKLGQNASRLQRTKGAFKTIWNKREIGEISSRLEYFRSELILHYAFQSRKTQLDQQTRQLSKDDIQAVLDRLDDLGPVLDGIKCGIVDRIDIQHSGLLNSIAEAKSENVQLHTQTAQQSLTNHSAVLGKLDNIQASIGTLSVDVRKGMQCQQSNTIESVAQVNVQNSTFLAGITQQIPLTSDPGSSLGHVLRSLLEEYKDKLVAEVSKEFREAARSEMDNMIQHTFPILDEMQHHSKTTQRDHEAIAEEAIIDEGPRDPGPQNSSRRRDFEVTTTQTHGKFDKNSLTMIYQKTRRIENRLGSFSLNIRDLIHFDAFGIPTEVYELTAQFNPSPRWLSTGCSIIYRNKSDARGSPDFGLRLKPYPVLDDNHEIFSAIEDGDICRVRDMLSQKTISTSARGTWGDTLLHCAVRYGELEICKTLVQSGADINARTIYGHSPIEFSVFPSNLWDNQQGRDIFHYLLSLNGVELEGFWFNPDMVEKMKLLMMFKFRRPLNIDNCLRDWISICRLIDVDLEIPGSHTFLQGIVDCFSTYEHGVRGFSRISYTYSMPIFDTLVQLGILNSSPAAIWDIPVAYAACRMRQRLIDVREDSLIANKASPTLSVSYRGYYAYPTVAQSLHFLEHVISKGIAQRPDSIFDTYDEISVSDWFYKDRYGQYIWESILEEHGFDVDWVYEEDDRRQETIMGETTAHEVSVTVDASEALEVKRRRGYENHDD